MTDTNDLERAERIRRLQERRAASAQTANRAVATTDDRGRRRTHARADVVDVRPRSEARSASAPRRRDAVAPRRAELASFLAIGGTVAAANQANVSTRAARGNSRPRRRPQRSQRPRQHRHHIDAEGHDGFDDDRPSPTPPPAAAEPGALGSIHMRSHTGGTSARAGGIVSWALATLAVIGGLQLSTRLLRKPAPAWTLDVHRFLAGLAVAFLGVHLLGLALDRFIGFGPADFFVPFASNYKPAALALGVVAMYLLLAVEITSLLMRHMPRHRWHAIHLTSYVVFVIATVHGLTAGTDRHNARLPVGLPGQCGPRPHDDARPGVVAAPRRPGQRRRHRRSHLTLPEPESARRPAGPRGEFESSGSSFSQWRQCPRQRP